MLLVGNLAKEFMLILLLMKSRFKLILLSTYLNPDLLSNRLQHECLRTTKEHLHHQAAV